MAKNYSYPRVTISQYAKTRSAVVPAQADTTILFMPFIAQKGPLFLGETIHTLSDFINTYGALDFERNGQTALIIYNWLSSGGTLLPYRLSQYKYEEFNSSKKYKPLASEKIKFKARQSVVEGKPSADVKEVILFKSKHLGSGYDNLSVKFTVLSEKTIKISVYLADEKGINHLEEEYRVTNENVGTMLDASNYLEYQYPTEWGNHKYTLTENKVVSTKDVNSFVEFVKVLVADGKKGELVSFDDYTRNYINSSVTLDKEIPSENESDDSLYKLVERLWLIEMGMIGNDAPTGTEHESEIDGAKYSHYKAPYEGEHQCLRNKLETPIDLILDPGYPEEIKKLIMSFIDNSNDEAARDDIVGIFNSYEVVLDDGIIKFTGKEVPKLITSFEEPAKISESEYAHTNVAMYTQYFTIYDGVFTDKDIYVLPTYFLSKLIPFNDATYGTQYPTAGLRRGILDDAKSVNNNPTPLEKDRLFKNRINYCEKSAREYAFMSQRTYDGSSEDGYTSLSFLNNVRTLSLMKKEIERIGRNYLFEHNDSVTLSQMNNVLNRYMSNWIANRTLSYANVTVSQNPYSTEAVDVNLVIKFNNTIEVISVDITIE